MSTVPPTVDLAVRPCPIAELVPDPANPRQMPDEQMAALMRSIEQFGFVEPVVVRRSDRLVIGGHQRVEAARRLGFTHVPIVELDLSEHRDYTPLELTGGVKFPAIGELPYLLTLPGHGFYWFQLVEAGDDGEMR